MHPRLTLPIVIAAFGAAAMSCQRGCATSGGFASAGVANPFAERAWCARFTAKVAISGDYSINPKPLGMMPLPNATPTVRVFFEAIDPGDPWRAGPPPPFDLFVLPRSPRIAVPPQELCASRDVADGVEVSCLNDDGDVLTKVVDVAKAASAWNGRSDHCVVSSVSSEIGNRSLSSAQERWRATAEGCRGAHDKHVAVLLELRVPPAENWMDGHPLAALVRLRIPVLSVEKELGILRNLNRHPTRTTTAHGIELTTSDMDASKLAAYQAGHTIFYNIENAGSDSSAARAMQSIDLPCGSIATFEVRRIPPL